MRYLLFALFLFHSYVQGWIIIVSRPEVLWYEVVCSIFVVFWPLCLGLDVNIENIFRAILMVIG